MSGTDSRWVALSVTGLAAATLAVVFADGVDPAAKYGLAAVALVLGVLAVWAVHRERTAG